MNILNILTSHTTPLQTFGLSLYIGGNNGNDFYRKRIIY